MHSSGHASRLLLFSSRVRAYSTKVVQLKFLTFSFFVNCFFFGTLSPKAASHTLGFVHDKRAACCDGVWQARQYGIEQTGAQLPPDTLFSIPSRVVVLRLSQGNLQGLQAAEALSRRAVQIWGSFLWHGHPQLAQGYVTLASLIEHQVEEDQPVLP